MTDRPLETGWLADTPPGDNLLRAFTLNQADVNEALARACGGRTERLDGAVLTDAASPVPYYNQALLLRPLTGIDDPLLDTIASFYAASTTVRTILSPWPTPDLSSRGWDLVG
ncbi:MAG: N-acetyltransferase, partial [Acidimicrobiia bacterium]